MVKAVYIALIAAALTACGFNERKYSDRACSTDQDCPRPDQSCSDNTCVQHACSAASDCGTAFAFDCVSGGCVATGCTTASECPLGYTCGASSFCQASFNVVSAQSVSNTSISVTFDAPPDSATAGDASNYSVSGLTISGTPAISGSTVTLTTSGQSATSYTVTVANVTRSGDHAPLGAASATFTGRASFNVMSALATSARTVEVTFDAPPDAATAATLANYMIDGGLAVSGTPTILGNTVTVTTAAQAVQLYTITVGGVTRASDGEALTGKVATFTGRNDFNLVSAVAVDTNTIVLTFDALPEATSAATLGNYSVTGPGGALSLSGVPVLDGVAFTVTLTSANQSVGTYTVTVTNVVRASDSEPLAVNQKTFSGIPPFNVVSATATTSHQIQVTFSSPPDSTLAQDPANYAVPGLSLGTPVLSGATVTIPTSAQSATGYTVTVQNGMSGVVRASDAEPLTTNAANFTGRAPFDVISAVATTSQTVVVTFDGPPGANANVAANYMIVPGLSVTSANYPGSGNVVTLTTSPQSNATFTLTVSNITRFGDSEPLTTAVANFAGVPTFNVLAAAGVTPTSFSVTYDAPPTSGAGTNSATKNTNYALSCGTCTTTPTILGVTLAGSVATVTTTTPVDTSSHMYTVTVTNVTRASDGEPIANNSASFTGIPPFDVTSAASVGNTSVTVTFSAAPTLGAAQTPGNYVITGGGGLAVSAAVLSGNTVTLTTAAQGTGTGYTVTVNNVTRASDSEILSVNSANFTGKSGFNVVGATSASTTSVTVTYDALPTTTGANSALLASNYAIACVTGCSGGLTPSAPSIVGNTVTLTTGAQAAATYQVTVSNVTRASDNVGLSIATAQFQHTTFNVQSAAALTSHSINVTFDAPPSAAATNYANYTISCTGGCTAPTVNPAPAPVLNGNTVTLSTTAQTGGQSYKVTVANVTRASDATALTTTQQSFTGIAPFNVMSAASVSSASITVTFSAAPTAAEATTLGNYSVKDGSNVTLAISGTPILSGNTVTIQTAPQKAVMYQVTVGGVTRAADTEPLTTTTASFTGTAQSKATVTAVAVQSTNPSNGTVFYNTGTATVVITGTNFSGTVCPTGVALNDKDGTGAVISTHPQSCTVDSDTQITATFPPGILSNYTGWDVLVTNTTNMASTVVAADKLIVKAGLVVAAVLASYGTSTAHQYFEIYNPTGTAINVNTLGLMVHARSSAGADTTFAITWGGAATLNSHTYLLAYAAGSDCSGTTQDPWCAHKDVSYTIANSSSPQVFTQGTIYLSLSGTAQTKVLDKVGWSNQSGQTAPLGSETGPLGNSADGKAAERKPGGAAGGAGTDTDSNTNDWNGFSSTIHPLGEVDGAKP